MRSHPTLALTSALVLAGVSLSACRSSPMSVAADGPAPHDAGSAAASDAFLGGFVISLISPVLEDGVVATPGYTTLLGRVTDRATPPAVVWNVVAEGGGCRLLTPQVPICSPGCGGTAVCAADGTCVEYPRALSLGRVHVKGLAGGELDMDEIAGNYQLIAPLPYPPMPEGGKVELTAPGGQLGPLRLQSVGIAPLEFTSRVQPIPGQPLVLAWRPPAQANSSRIEIEMDISHHGGSKGKIECDVADTGTFTISAAHIAALLELGVSGFPTVVVTRVASAGASTRLGRATLRVVASIEREVEIEGLHSCRANEDCPAGMSCQVDLKCQ